MVKNVNLPKKFVKTLFRAIPVTIPGSAIGSTKRRDIASLPKNSYLDIAAAASEPRMSAIEVAIRAVMTERITASRIPSLAAALLHQTVVKPVGGQANDLLVLKEFITTRANGR
jgi:hypothetical protein